MYDPRANNIQYFLGIIVSDSRLRLQPPFGGQATVVVCALAMNTADIKESPGRAGACKELTMKGNPGIKVP